MQTVWIALYGVCATFSLSASLIGARANQFEPTVAGVIFTAETPVNEQIDERPLMKKAQTLLMAGDVSGARAIYLYLAMKGSAAGALGVADTYDPITLKAIPNAGLKGDPLQVETWTRRAKELEQRLAPKTAQDK